MKSAFFGLDITGVGNWPGYPEVPKRNSEGVILDTRLPIQYQGNPKAYYKWLRVIPGSGIGWIRFLFLPPRSETPLIIDRAITDSHEAVSAWSLLIRRPESEGVRITTYTVTETLTVLDSRLQRADLRKIINCQITKFPEAIEESSTVAEVWDMTQGSALFDSGRVYFKVTNTLDIPQTLCSIASFEPRDIRDIISAKTIKTHLPYSVAWANK